MSVVTSLINKLDREHSSKKQELAIWEQKLSEQKRLIEEQEKNIIHMINPNRICTNRNQPRTVFDDDSIISLSESIKQYGIIQPLTVRVLSEKDEPFGGLYELVAGERRLRAAKLLGLECVPCIFLEADAEDSAKLALVENMQRQDLNLFDEAMAIFTLCNKYSLSQKDVAAALGVSQPYVANKLRLLRLSSDEKSIILQNGLSERHARAVLRIEDAELRIKALSQIAKEGYNVVQAEEFISRLLSGDEKQKPMRKLLLKDIRIFLNSVDRAVVMIKDAGFDIEQTKREVGENIELVIRIPKNKYTDN